jgi:hypothetical protein
MRMLTVEEAFTFFGGRDRRSVIDDLADRRLPHFIGPYSVPGDSAKKTVLSKTLANLLMRESEIYLYITAWNVFADHMDLFYGYRRSFGETRLLIDVPFHIFDPNEKDELISVLCMIFYFFWDAWVFDRAESFLLGISHDEYFKLWTADEETINSSATAFSTLSLSLCEDWRKDQM